MIEKIKEVFDRIDEEAISKNFDKNRILKLTEEGRKYLANIEKKVEKWDKFNELVRRFIELIKSEIGEIQS
jgi:DNA-binding MarR family transcriptional regulator